MQYLKIPTCITKMKNISLLDKLILGYLYGMHCSDNNVFVTNRYLANILGSHTRSIQYSLAYLCGDEERKGAKLKFPYVLINISANGKRFVKIQPDFASVIDEQMEKIVKISQEKIEFKKEFKGNAVELYKALDNYGMKNVVNQ